jgi:hypothetical protein
VIRACTLGLLAALLVFGPVSCAAHRGSGGEVVATEAGAIRLEFVEWNEATADLLRSAVPEAAKLLSRWGGLAEPVRITVVNAHWELEEAVGRPLPGISAWARRNRVVLWDPRWWPLPPGVADHPCSPRRCGEPRSRIFSSMSSPTH